MDTIVLYPSPLEGHFKSMVELGKTLLDHHHSPPFSVVIVVPPPPHEAADSTVAHLATISASHPNISFLHLPPTPSGTSSFKDDFITSSFECVRLNKTALHASLSDRSDSPSAVKALVLDFFCTAASDVGASLGIPVYYFYTSGASGMTELLYFPTIHTTVPHSLKDLDPDTVIEIPGLPPLRRRDVPEPIWDRGSKAYGWFLDLGHDMARAAGLIMNTFDSFEVSAVSALRRGLCVKEGPTPPTYCVGPLVPAASINKGGGVEPRHECLRWLDEQPSRSVVFLSFGSMGRFHTKQLKEMALGLERSGARFLWVVRDPPPDDETLQKVVSETAPINIKHFLPEGFLERVKGRGLVVESWAPQVPVLNHGSIGGFVTHCGWNSILESVCAGVPMLAWPLYAEQKLNRTNIVEAIGVALWVRESEDEFVSASELEERVVELMSSEKGGAVRKRVLKMKEEAAAALREGGSSHSAVAELIESIKRGPVGVRGSNKVQG